jgi:hypothetical protein
VVSHLERKNVTPPDPVADPSVDGPASSASRWRRFVAAAPVVISLAALGVAIWSIVQSEDASHAQEQSQSRQAAFVEAQAEAQARQTALAEAQTVQFVGGTSVADDGTTEVDAKIENFNRVPLIYDEIRWSDGDGDSYVTIDSCEVIELTAPADEYTDPLAFITGATLYYRTPDGNLWARQLNGLPYPLKSYPEFSHGDSEPEPMSNCQPA